MSFYRSLSAVFAILVFSVSALADEASGIHEQEQIKANQSVSASKQESKVDVNKATMMELIKVEGITPARAKAIISYRNKHGDFKSVDDLKEVKGFKKMKMSHLKEIQDQLTAG